jgi:hypothetical protein
MSAVAALEVVIVQAQLEIRSCFPPQSDILNRLDRIRRGDVTAENFGDDTGALPILRSRLPNYAEIFERTQQLKDEYAVICRAELYLTHFAKLTTLLRRKLQQQ